MQTPPPPQRLLTGKGRRMLKEGIPSAKEARSLSAVTSGVTTPKSILLLEEGTMHTSLDDPFTNLSTCSSRVFYQRPATKNTK